MTYIDDDGRSWVNAQLALDEFLSELPPLTTEETELAFQFTHHLYEPELNLQAIAFGIVYSGLSEQFKGYPVPVCADYPLTADERSQLTE